MTTVSAAYIGGEWIEGGPQADSIDPSNGEVFGHFQCGNRDLVDQAVACARQTFEQGVWADSPRLRSDALFELATALERDAGQLSEMLVAENGKLLAEARGEVAGAISEIRYYAGLARTVMGRTFQSAPDVMSLLHREPAGVVAIIVPWNAPITLLARSLAPALAAGCTTVIKPALQTSVTHGRFMECVNTCASLPKGVVNSVNEVDDEVGRALVAHPDVDVVSFTGSTQTGRKIMASAAPTLKRLSLELGGKAPAVIFEDADLDLACAELTRGSLVMAGQMCVAAARFLVHEKIAPQFIEKMKHAYSSVRTGPGSDPQSQMGALIDKANQQRVLALIEQAGDEGELIVRGEPLEGSFAQGSFVTPTLFRIEDTSSSLVQDELFGPIVSLETFGNESEAIAKANATSFGLAASVFTRNLNLSMRASRRIRSGTVWLNSHTRLFAEAETGGYRQSGLGRLHGVEGLNDFLETKHVYFEAGLS
ncbi:aldehyde dehydrogenase family protein [Pelagibacterium halotolerans]|uniref:Aldehyde dehydrogenase A n=1 Tax=Pelagibacterium halotolerans (strain DSM 22347 / JCM 15775 / CGMCC 1.7692 / B2) TaxID=1082931 RepID=G4RD69_PELHB|nr:aldehyde dehydrogenase family protein [Pelagibacterium halotolerans]AEQ53819.1 aldehyde dehydrogenase A [Pelagibacterium halotolerans B2]QJR20030.1 aldehyde dehydrogenase family protein [Pelagibacterium halotolerans]SEA81659.1 Acyl-CoA reductase [Pelagibacterium halotolerans]